MTGADLYEEASSRKKLFKRTATVFKAASLGGGFVATWSIPKTLLLGPTALPVALAVAGGACIFGLFEAMFTQRAEEQQTRDKEVLRLTREIHSMLTILITAVTTVGLGYLATMAGRFLFATLQGLAQLAAAAGFAGLLILLVLVVEHVVFSPSAPRPPKADAVTIAA